MSKKNKSTRPRMTYEEREELERIFGTQTICGYARNFYKSKDTIVANCSLSGEGCRRKIPMHIDSCPVYNSWLQERKNYEEKY